jgi:hypothetical protein
MPTANALNRMLINMVVPNKAKLVRVCRQLLNPPVNNGRMPSMMTFKVMQIMIHISFCEDGIPSKKARNCSMGVQLTFSQGNPKPGNMFP